MKDVHCSETIEKLIIRFVRFSILWVMVDCVYNLQVCHHNFIKCVTQLLFFIVPKDAHCSETVFLVHKFFCAIFSFWDMVDFVFDIRSELRTLRTCISFIGNSPIILNFFQKFLSFTHYFVTFDGKEGGGELHNI